MTQLLLHLLRGRHRAYTLQMVPQLILRTVPLYTPPFPDEASEIKRGYNTNEKNAGVAVLVSDRADFKVRGVIRDQ